MSSSVKVVFNSGAIKTLENRFMNLTHLMAYDVAKQARANAPVLTGNLRSSIETVKTKDGLDVIAGENGFVYGHAQYAYKQELYNPRKSRYMGRAFSSTFSGSWEGKYYGGLVR